MSDGKLVIISGPSGAGKSTVVSRLLATCAQPLKLSVSATTRQPRAREVHGVNYFFLDKGEFERRRAAGEFLECKEVFGCGDWYGTPKSEVTTGFAAGKWVVLEIDVQGALSVLETFPDAITIFLHPGSRQELERRLRSRGTETESSIQRRLDVADSEMRFMDRYRHEVINDDIDRAVAEICKILAGYRPASGQPS